MNKLLHTRLLWFAAGLTVSQRLIVIHPNHRDDKPLLAHERTHQQQMRKVGTLAFWWRYLTDRQFRLWCEVEAYKEQAKYYETDELPMFAGFVSKKYSLNISEEGALKLLKE